jgi:hypothetical protein
MNPNLPDVVYRSNLGFSTYRSISALFRYEGGRGQVQAAYTYGHSIDNQSDPLLGDFLDLNLGTTGERRPILATFTRQFDPLVDKGNSDFDQRHNLVILSIWRAPRLHGFAGRLLNGFRFSQLAGFRSGFPYTLIVPGTPPILNNRPDLLRPDPRVRVAAPGGVQLLDTAAFADPCGNGVSRRAEQPAEPCLSPRVGTLGRNSLAGPGLWNIDVSLSRTLTLPGLGETRRIELRADIFNVVNHTNLGNPNPYFNSKSFGVATYGRSGRESGFPAAVPLSEAPRQVQLQLRVFF